MHAVFISYSAEDKTVAFSACKVLEAGGVTCWIAPRDVMAGRPYSGQLTEAIRRARVFVLILSRKSDQSRQVLREVERAGHSRVHLVTFRIEDFEPSDDLAYFLSIEHWLNAFEGAPQNHFPQLLQHTAALVREDAPEAQGAQIKLRADAEPVGTQKFANYHILKHPDGTLFRLGPGAMGVTYKAFDTSLNRHVALKVIGSDLLGSDEARRRFLREARAAAKIQHPHVAAIYHLGQEGEDYFYTMELVEGEDMERYVAAHGPLSLAPALRATLQVAEALEAAQAHKLIHRDIKPANIMVNVNRSGKLDVKLIDFGLAKGAGPASLDASRLTHTMTFVGSPAYSSPEQCEMGDLDTRSDIYSLGATLWYLLTGKPPFLGNVNQVLIAHATKLPAFEQLEGFPEPLVELLRRMLAKTPNDRPRSPRELQEAIQELETQLASNSSKLPEEVSAKLPDVQVEELGAVSPIESGEEPATSPLLDTYLGVGVGIRLEDRYWLVEEQMEGNGGRLFQAHDEKAVEGRSAQIAVKLLHPGIASDPALLDLLADEIDVIKSATHSNLLVYFGLERGASVPFLVREWVHGFLLYDLLRLRLSFKPDEVVSLLEPLAATLDFVSDRSLGLVEVSIRKLFLAWPEDVRTSDFTKLAKGDTKNWVMCTLKLNPLSLAPLLFRERRDWSSKTLAPSSRLLSMTQAEAGIRSTRGIGLLGRLVYELITGHAPSSRDKERPSPLPLLSEAGNQVLSSACVSAGEGTPFRNCEDFWRAFKESLSDRGHPEIAQPRKPEMEHAVAETSVNLDQRPEDSSQSKPRSDPAQEGTQTGTASVWKSILPRRSFGASGGKTLSKGVIALLAILAVFGAGALLYLATGSSQSKRSSEQTVAQPSSISAIASPSVPSPISVPATPIPRRAVIPSGVTIRFAGDSDVGEGGRWSRAVAEEWAKKTGNNVEYINRPNDASATLQQFRKYWAAESPDIDVYMVDVIWQGILAPHAVDLKKYFREDEIAKFFPRNVENNTVDGRLVSLPWFADAGILYYRTDLLEKYGYKEPPKTWEDLTEMAKRIQDGERATGMADFHGFVFQGKASESVTCNAIEWIYSFNGGTIVEPDRKVTINNPGAIAALRTARGWVGTISPRGVITYGEEEARNVWQAGNAAFMRNWPYAYALGNDPRSLIAGRFDVTVLPKGGLGGKNAACLGGWQLMVSAYSKAPEAAADLVRYLASEEQQRKRAIGLGLLPTRPTLYSDAAILAKYPWFENLLDVLTNAVARPSTVTGADYNQLSTAFFQNVNKMLAGTETPQDAVSQVEKVARRIVR